jgi:hypothetical protein
LARLGVPARSLDWYWLPLFPMFVIFFISALAETNRPPFDLPEAESELVAGFMVEYSSTPYLLFMLGEYVAIVLMCAMTTILFLGGWLPPFDLRAVHLGAGRHLVRAQGLLVFFMFAMVKAIVPRYRYDQLMRLGWKVFLPLSHGRDRGVLVHGRRRRPRSARWSAWQSVGSSLPAGAEVIRGPIATLIMLGDAFGRNPSARSRPRKSLLRSSSAPSSCRCAISSRPRRR